MNDSPANMIRTVGFLRIQRIAQDLSNVLDLPVTHAERLAILISQGDERKSKAALLYYFHRQLRRLQQGPSNPARLEELQSTYLYVDGLITGTARMMPSELRLMGEVVHPEDGAQAMAWPRFVSKHFRDILRVDEGTEANVVAGRGKGKTHLMVLSGKEWTALSPNNIVIHNIPNLVVEDPESAKHWHEIAYTSEIVKLWLENFGKHILLLLDEPAQTLMSQPGNNKEIDSWNRVRPMLRKMRIITLYAWQFEGQIFKQLREDPVVVRINKPSKEKAVLHWVDDEGEHGLAIEAIPPLVGVRYDTYSLTSVYADLIFPNLVRAVRQAGAKTPHEVVDVLRQAIQNKDNYDPEYWSDHDFPDETQPTPKADATAEYEEKLAQVRGDYYTYLNSWGLVDANEIHRRLACSHGDAKAIAKTINREYGLKRVRARPKPA